MRFRQVMLASCIALGCFAEAPKSHANEATVRGKLTQRAGKPPAVETAEHKLITFEGTDDALKVLNDARLNGFDLEARGRFVAPDRFRVGGNHARSLLVHKDGAVKMVTYWCETCAIRSYAPGACWCCQAETELELRPPEEP